MDLKALGFNIPSSMLEDLFNLKYMVEFNDNDVQSEVHIRGTIFYISKCLIDIDNFASQENETVTITNPRLQNIVTGEFIENKNTSRVSYERTTTNQET